MSFLQFLTVKSFITHNPDWQIELYTPVKPFYEHTWQTQEQKDLYRGKDYLSRVYSLEININVVDFAEIGFRNDLPEVMKADYLRYYMLGKYGGLWSDFDILFFKPISKLSQFVSFEIVGDPENINTILCPVIKDHKLKYHTIGLLMSSASNKFFSDLAHNCSKYLDISQYQSIGVTMLNKLFPSIAEIKNQYGTDINVLVLPHSCYLPFEWNETKFIFEELCPTPIMDHTIGLHWFNGHRDAKEFQNKLGNPKNKISETGHIFHYLKPYLTPVNMTEPTPDIDITMHSDSLKNAFNTTYSKNLWSDPESKSGTGSNLKSTMQVRNHLQVLLSRLKIKSIGDLGCGDFNWMKETDLSGINYVGIDIVQDIIHENTLHYSSSYISFKTSNIIQDPIDKCDLIILRDVMVHLTFETCFHLLNNIIKSKSKYLYVTTFLNDRVNTDLVQNGHQWRSLSLQNAPFNFPTPLDIILENCEEANGKYMDKAMMLVEIQELRELLKNFHVSPLWFPS